MISLLLYSTKKLCSSVPWSEAANGYSSLTILMSVPQLKFFLCCSNLNVYTNLIHWNLAIFSNRRLSWAENSSIACVLHACVHVFDYIKERYPPTFGRAIDACIKFSPSISTWNHCEHWSVGESCACIWSKSTVDKNLFKSCNNWWKLNSFEWIIFRMNAYISIHNCLRIVSSKTGALRLGLLYGCECVDRRKGCCGCCCEGCCGPNPTSCPVATAKQHTVVMQNRSSIYVSYGLAVFSI